MTELTEFPTPQETLRQKGTPIRLSDGREWDFAFPCWLIAPVFNAGECKLRRVWGVQLGLRDAFESFVRSVKPNEAGDRLQAEPEDYFRFAKASLQWCHELDDGQAEQLLTGSFDDFQTIATAILMGCLTNPNPESEP